ncbi:MAG: phenylalanine--tRNA ligase subunit beta [Solirubrobacterales bacterium]|nr:phenylalanine--tRNA ligase subunit beta [Solirubrobacterales bacterium]
MRVPLHWLQEYCHPPLETSELAQRLTMTGTKVEGISWHGVGAPEHFVVGKVLERRRHPNAERLSVCMVDVGGSSAVQIVCGAPNVEAGQAVAVARPGAVIGGTKLGKAQLRGVESDGMILAEDELAIGTDHAGILVLADGAGGSVSPGAPLSDVLPLGGEVLELEITANRPDCLGVYGIAREVHAATGAALGAPPWAEDDGTPEPIEGVTITVECPELCPRFTARVFEDVKIGPSPPWLKARLMAAGQRPISNVVDITNYVMLLTGQPLHAFDLDRVAGQTLIVRTARASEPVVTLDGQTRALDEQMVLIADADGPTSIAGVMGGERSEVQSDTTRVLMEVATWDGPNIHRTAWTLGLQSEASLRFEKQLQPEQAMEAQAIATRLMVELCGASLSPGTIDVGGPGPEPQPIRLQENQITALLGAPIPRERCAELLTSLEFEVAEAPDGLDVRTPAFRRGDVTREVDVIEEVARLDGLEKIPATLPSRHGASGRLTVRQQMRRQAADLLRAQGLSEVVGWSFTGPEQRARLRHQDGPAVELENPMSSDQSLLRTSLLGSLLDVARHNRAHGAGALRLFEAGAVYLPREGQRLPDEPYCLAGLEIGSVRTPTWRDPVPPAADFYAIKGTVAALLDGLRVSWTSQRAQASFVHPGRAASVWVGQRPVGWFGEVHPLVARDWDLEEKVAAFELDLDALPGPPFARYLDLTSFPEVREDLAVVVGDEVPAADVIEVVRQAGQPLLARAEVFDVYRDAEKLGASNKSLALRLAFRAADRTLTDQEVARQRQAIVAALAERLGASIRES